jgi:hypothetical protein
MELTGATRHRISTFMVASGVEMVVSALQAIYGLMFLLLGIEVIVLGIRGSAHYAPETWACMALGLEGYALTYLGLLPLPPAAERQYR